MSSSQVQGTGYTEDDRQRIEEAYAQAKHEGDQVIENPVASPQNRLTTISVACIIANRMIGDLNPICLPFACANGSQVLVSSMRLQVYCVTIAT